MWWWEWDSGAVMGMIEEAKLEFGRSNAASFDPKAAGPGLLNLLARAADVPDFATLEAHLAETQARVRASFVRILGKAP